MRLRQKRLSPSVHVTEDPRRPITLTAGPALQFELELDEGRKLAWALADAIEAVQHRGGGES